MKLLAVLAAVLVAITNNASSTTIRANTRIACVLTTTVDSTTAQSGDEFQLRVTDDAQPALYGAVIRGHITHVVQPRGLERAEIAFFFDDITFLNHTREPIRAYVVASNVTQRNSRTPPPGLTMPASRPAQSTIVWQTQLGPKTTPTTRTGGYAYATKNGAPLVVNAGTAVTIVLASDLQTP